MYRSLRTLAPVAVALAGALLALPGLVAARTPRARTLLVGSYRGQRGAFRTIQSAVDAARSGDVILVGPGVYHERADRGSPASPAARRPERGSSSTPRASRCAASTATG
jgi:pectin methylesterase-like acyl-CoA thioesterase